MTKMLGILAAALVGAAVGAQAASGRAAGDEPARRALELASRRCGSPKVRGMAEAGLAQLAGQGAPKDENAAWRALKAAGRWCDSPAVRGPAEFAIGDMLEHGRGRPADPVLAYLAYRSAAGLNEPGAAKRAETVLATLTPTDAQRGLSAAANANAAAALAPLIRRGGALDGLSPDGLSPLHAAVQGGGLASVRALLEAGAKVDMPGAEKGREGETPLFYAVYAEAPPGSDIVSLLLAHGASPNAKSAVGRTPLMAAAQECSLSSTNALLAAGAARDVAWKGKTAADLAQDRRARAAAEGYTSEFIDRCRETAQILRP